MIPLTLEQVAEVVGGQLGSSADARRMVSGVSIDTRTLRPGELFVPLAGEHVDGHRYIAAAMRAGASGYLAAAAQIDAVTPLPPGCVVVDDPQDALLGLGVWVRDTVDPRVVAVTGSNGKTTTKDLIAAACRSRRITANEGSFNNELGVPLTCCRLNPDSELLVSEIGTRGVGQIARLAALLRPEIAVVTSIAAAHLELLGDVATIARAKAELVEALGPEGVAVLNADDPRVMTMATRAPGRVVTYGGGVMADWRASRIALDDQARAEFVVDGPLGSARVRLPVPGRHNVANALAALAVAAELDLPLELALEGLQSATVSRWRMQVSDLGGVRVLNDAYNANPASMTAALRTLVAMRSGGRRWAVLGEMAEIGPTSAAAHAEVGAEVARLGVDRLVTVGSSAVAIRQGADATDPSGASGRTDVSSVGEALSMLASELHPGDVVLVKASRAARLERVVTGLEDLVTAGAAGNARS